MERDIDAHTLSFFAELGAYAGKFDIVSRWFQGERGVNYGELTLVLTKSEESLKESLRRVVENGGNVDGAKRAVEVLEQQIPHYDGWYHSEYRDGISVTIDSYGNEVGIRDRVMAKAMEENLCRAVKSVKDIFTERVSLSINKQIENFVLSDEAYREIMIERGEYIESDSIEIADVSPLENQRSITDNAVWWITKAMQSNKGVSIPDTKTAEGLKTILNKTNDKLYERRSLSRTRTEIKSLKEFLQQLLDNVPPPKD